MPAGTPSDTVLDVAVLKPIEVAKPGETILYQATLKNTEAKLLRGVRPEIPVPTGLVVDVASARPAAAEGSLDGVKFTPLPLLDTQGQPIPAADIRALRWAPVELAPDSASIVTVRMNVAR